MNYHDHRDARRAKARQGGDTVKGVGVKDPNVSKDDQIMSSILGIDYLIDNPEFETLIKNCFKLWGFPSQLIMLGEEQAELFKAISHNWRNLKEGSISEVKEEIADNIIMLAEFIVWLKIPLSDILETMNFKLDRLDDRVKEGSG